MVIFAVLLSFALFECNKSYAKFLSHFVSASPMKRIANSGSFFWRNVLTTLFEDIVLRHERYTKIHRGPHRAAKMHRTTTHMTLGEGRQSVLCTHSKASRLMERGFWKKSLVPYSAELWLAPKESHSFFRF